VVGRIRFTADTPPGLRQNQRVTSRLVMDQLENILKVQRGSFTDSGGGRYAFVMSEDGMAHKRAITLGGRSISEIEVVSGLEAGETIVISSLADFIENDIVQIVD